MTGTLKADDRPYLIADANRLERLAAEIGDGRLADAATALRELRVRETRRHDSRHVHDIISELAERCAADMKSTRAKAYWLELVAKEYECGGWQKHRHRMTAPAGLSDIDDLLWRIFSRAGAMPSFESLRKILEGRYY